MGGIIVYSKIITARLGAGLIIGYRGFIATDCCAELNFSGVNTIDELRAALVDCSGIA